MTIEIVINNKTDITDFVSSVDLSGDTSKFNRQLDINFSASSNGRKPAIEVNVGDVITFKYNRILRFIGIVFNAQIASSGELSVTAYDSNVYLAKSTENITFINKKASEIIRILSNNFEISLGDIADTGYVIPYLKFKQKTLYDMILIALKLTRQQTGKRFFIGNDEGKLTLTEGAANTDRYVFADGQNLISASYTQSIEDMITQVKVVGGAKGKETVAVAKDDDKRRKYGVLQAVEVMDEKATATQVRQRAATLLKKQSQVSEQLSVEVLGVPDVDVGSPVYIVNEMTRTKGAYYVTNIKHSYTDGLHTMSLELTRTYELPDIDIDSEIVTKEVPKAKKKKTTKKSKKKTTKKEEAKKNDGTTRR